MDFEAGLVISPPIMTGWDRFDIRGWFAPRYPCPVVVEKDANAMVFGEQPPGAPGHVRNMLYVKLGTGVGSGLIADGQIYRGADGAAGDIGHNQIPIPDDAPEPLCRCGNTGCVEAYAGGWALVRDLQAAGLDVTTVDDAERLKAGDATPCAWRAAAGILGAALADAVNLLNPRVVVLGGQLAEPRTSTRRPRSGLPPLAAPGHTAPPNRRSTPGKPSRSRRNRPARSPKRLHPVSCASHVENPPEPQLPCPSPHRPRC